MQCSRKLLIGIILILMSPIFVVLLWIGYAVGHGLLLKAMGYDVDVDPKELAIQIYENQESVKRCNNLMQSVPTMGPTIGDKRMRCIFEYASIAKDPSACELLMPSGYGLSCVGGAENHQLPCNTDVKPYSVYWRDGTTEHTVHVRECMHQNRDSADLSSQCCAVARVAFLKDENDCTHLKTVPSVYDRCLYALAWKLRDAHYCTEISNQNAKAACIVQSNAIKKDPSICRGCIPPIESIEALK